MSPRADAIRNRSKILSAAARVFAAQGAAASTEQVAAEAGVAIGTVFRHFPTKLDLLAAIMKDTLDRIAERMTTPGATLADIFAELIRESAAKRSVIDLLPGLDVPEAISRFRAEVGTLVAQAQQTGTVRTDVRVDEVLALLIALCRGAVYGGWDDDLQKRTLAIVLAGLESVVPGT
jgi:AcrR family transcriptional regulator